MQTFFLSVKSVFLAEAGFFACLIRVFQSWIFSAPKKVDFLAIGAKPILSGIVVI